MIIGNLNFFTASSSGLHGVGFKIEYAVMNKSIQRSIQFLFFLSGFTALVFEVVWAKQVALLFGNSTFAVATTLSAFMCGLSLGSWYFGKVADQKPKLGLIIYGCLEGGIGLFALIYPVILSVLDPFYRIVYQNFYSNYLVLNAIRFALSFIILLVPTTLMGGTFPFLAKHLQLFRNLSTPDSTNRLYTVNLIGAVSGSLLSGFVILPAIGLTGTVWAAVMANGFILFMSYRLHSKMSPISLSAESTAVFSESAPSEAATPIAVMVLLTAFFQGLCVFIIQICWTRLMALILGASVYAFSAVLTTVLAGMAAGSWLIQKIGRYSDGRPNSFLAMALLGSSASALLFLPAFERSFFVYVRCFNWFSDGFGKTICFQFLLCAGCMSLPAVLNGMVFPMLLRLCSRETDLGKRVGLLYSVNTLGAVAGSCLAAVVLIQRWGLVNSIKIAAVVQGLLGAAFWIRQRTKKERPIVIAQASLAVFMIAALQLVQTDRAVLTSGVFNYADHMREFTRKGFGHFKKALIRDSRLLFFKDGLASTVSVHQMQRNRHPYRLPDKSLRINGKVDATTSGDMPTQVSMAYLPMLAHDDPKEILVIGLGSGVTAGCAAQFPGVKHLDVVEIEPAVVEANQYFTIENHGVIKDPRVNIIIGDGRNHIAYSRRSYDVILSEPSNPWIAGVAALYTQENYLRSLSQLKETGIYCQWFHSYQMTKEQFLSIIKTFCSVFPEAALFHVQKSDYLILGSRRPIHFDELRIERALKENPEIQNDLNGLDPYRVFFLQGSFLLSSRDLKAALGVRGTGQIYHDDHMRLEYEAPKALYRWEGVAIQDWLDSVPRRDLFPVIGGWSIDENLNNETLALILANKCDSALLGERFADAMSLAKKIRLTNVKGPRLSGMIAKAYELSGKLDEAIDLYSQMIRDYPAWEMVAGCGLRRAKIERVLMRYPKNKRDVRAYNIIAELSYYMDDQAEAIKWLQKGIELDPLYEKNYVDMAEYTQAKQGYYPLKEILKKAGEYLKHSEAIDNAKKMMEWRPRIRFAEVQVNRAKRYLQDKQVDEAISVLEEAMTSDPMNDAACDLMAHAQMLKGNADQAAINEKMSELIRAKKQKKR